MEYFQVEMFSITNLHHQFMSESKELYKLDNGAFYAVIFNALTVANVTVETLLENY